MTKALDFAHYLLILAGHEDEPDCLTHLQIQKLLYYFQGWSLALRGRAAFPEVIQAWRHGPVVPALYSHFAPFEKSAVANCCHSMTESLSSDDSYFAMVVWNAYKKYSAIGLADKTHAESPWKDARAGLPSEASCETVISLDAMRTFFSTEKEADKECHFVGIPQWSDAADDKALVELAKRSFIRNAALLRRLAQ